MLQMISWSVELNIIVDPTKPLGHRTVSINPVRQRDPVVMDAALAPPLPESALCPPNANSAQTLVWWPSDGKQLPTVIVRPTMSSVSDELSLKTFLNPQSERACLLHRVSAVGMSPSCPM